MNIFFVYLVTAIVGGLISAAIAWNKTENGGQTTIYAVIGFLIPLIGIIAACLLQRPSMPPRPPGWYIDPWNRTMVRWYDGAQWTWHAQPAQLEQAGR